MSENHLKLDAPPIIEAVIDIDCDLPAGFDLVAIEESGSQVFGERYPKVRKQFVEQHHFQHKSDVPTEYTLKRGIHALQFLQEDEKQLVQVRAGGFSFNRLAPYTTLDDYLPEIERLWSLFVGFASPIQIKVVRLRYVNRLPLPLEEGNLEFQDYLNASPRLPLEGRLTFAGFLSQYEAIEEATGNRAAVVLATQMPQSDKLPLILDITVFSLAAADVNDWSGISTNLQSLRSLKNRIFEHTLTEKCLNLFRSQNR